MSELNIGRLSRVPLRTIWQHEAYGFTPWLAHAQNLQLLGDALGMALNLVSVEHEVGPFSADIVCSTRDSNERVVIENQLEKTDHKHLGQIITYAAGLGAKTVVWIAESFSEEHRAAVDWLNASFSERAGFFAVEIELWKIGDSPAAPRFNIVSRPNNWAKRVSELHEQKSIEALTPTKALQLEYWTQFRDFLIQCKSKLSARTPRAQHWYDFSVGRSGFWMSANLVLQQKRTTVHFIIGNDEAKEFFRQLEVQRRDVESEIGAKLEWKALDEGKQSRISVSKTWSDPELPSVWPEMNGWFESMLIAFEKALGRRARELDLPALDKTAS